MEGQFIYYIFDSFILLNILALAFKTYFSYSILFAINIIVDITLLIELMLKLLVIDKFLSQKKNLLETILVILCLSELIFSNVPISKLDLFITILTILKAALFYRLLKYNDFAESILIIASDTMPSYANLTLLMFFLIMNYALFGFQIFHKKFDKSQVVGHLHSFSTIE